MYYGDAIGSPGSILTFFPWAGLRRGRPGRGQVGAIAFAIPPGALDFWTERLKAKQIAVRALSLRFGERVLGFGDPDGLPLELIESSTLERAGARSSDIPSQYAIRAIHSVTLPIATQSAAKRVLERTMGYTVVASEEGRTRLAVGAGGPSTWVDLLLDPQAPSGLSGAGTVHHVAFRVADDDAQLKARRELIEQNFSVSPVMDRNYFHSIYYREPDGVLFEIATDLPGFAVDEPVEQLGETLKLPSQYEAHRADILAALPSLNEELS